MAEDLGDWTQEAAANAAGQMVENIGERKQQVANIVEKGIKMVQGQSQELAKGANGSLKKTGDS